MCGMPLGSLLALKVFRAIKILRSDKVSRDIRVLRYIDISLIAKMRPTKGWTDITYKILDLQERTYKDNKTKILMTNH